uniref:Teichoic acid biosynthesis protein B n=1 Tax=uncultured Bacillota bacterium TaxID=344338 RepID=A0A650EPJ3_9FIRM|nr:hypothetical protein Firmicute1046_3370 [uncultured Firmicutes bacterium]
MKKIVSVLTYAWYVVYYLFAYCVGMIAKRFPQYKNLWLIAERKTDARDNGLHLFKYITKNHPEINAAFVIESASPDYVRVSGLGKVIEPYTFRHMLAFACAEVRISTHYMGCSPDAYRFKRLDKVFHLVRGKNALIRHGITANDLPELHYPEARPDLLVCSAVPEYEDMTEHYSHPQGVIQMLGLCRFDRLSENHETKRQILIMPTWRYFLRGISDKDFKQSEYYKNFMGILSDAKLGETLNRYDLHIVLYLHYELQPYTKLFAAENPRIKVKSLGESDVQDLLMESAMLITDYSSVFYDFAYMAKPLAYLQFDEEMFYKTQYKRGYFNCHTDGFGPVFKTPEEVVGYICKKAETGMEMEEMYKRRVEKFFGEREANHCEKTFAALKRIVSL